MTKSKGRG